MLGLLRRYLRSYNKRYFPCYVFSFRPLVLVAYDSDFVKFKSEMLQKFLQYSQVKLFIQLGYERESDETFEPLLQELLDAQKQTPQLEITVLANTEVEQARFARRDVNAILCHQNAFLDERRYPLYLSTREFDAIYIARFTPCKRQELACEIPQLYLVGDYFKEEEGYATKCFNQLSRAKIVKSIPASRVSSEMARACCGLCLSNREGAMFVSAEYLLSGIPVVNVPNVGGRDELFSPEFVSTVEPNSAMVAQAVAHWVKNPQNPIQVRSSILSKMQVHRESLVKLLSTAIGKTWTKRLPHKLGLRRTLLIHELLLHGLRK